MHYDRFSEKNELVLLGHMCSLKVDSTKFNSFINFLASYDIKSNMLCSKLENFYYFTFFSKTTEKSEEIFNILLDWNP